jgi:hypothetical protein
LTIALASSSSLLAPRPGAVKLAPGERVSVRVTAKASTRPALAVVTGLLSLRPVGGQALRIPWAIEFHPPSGSLIRQVRLDPTSFAPSDTKPAVLQIVAGRISAGPRLEIQAVRRLDVLLYRASGAFLGVLASEHDLLPGDYSFAITGRGPTGAVLPAGGYELRISAYPVSAAAPGRARVAFRIK